MKIVPAGMSFERALLSGYLGRINAEPYLRWIRTLACDICNAQGPSDPSHINNYHKGMGSKAPDWWVVPHCRPCHEDYERWGAKYITAEKFLSRAALYLLRAIIEEKLVWKTNRKS